MCAWSSSSFASLVAERDVSEESSAALSLFLSQCRFQDRHVTCRAIASGFSGPRETRARTSILSFNFLLPVSNTLSLSLPASLSTRVVVTHDDCGDEYNRERADME